jgi:hypothetical protein
MLAVFGRAEISPLTGGQLARAAVAAAVPLLPDVPRA